jgi:transcriptional regulator with XRE-family HTH domain
MKLEAVIAARLKEAREASGMSQQALGVAVGIEEETAKVRIHQYEHGKHAPPFPMLERLAKVLNKPLAWFVCPSDEKELHLCLSAISPKTRAVVLDSIVDSLKNRPLEST